MKGFGCLVSAPEWTVKIDSGGVNVMAVGNQCTSAHDMSTNHILGNVHSPSLKTVLEHITVEQLHLEFL